ncbi:hypothetical protein ZTR_01000 [Talaromyces verruculosus]|nr:hypothetical protein ZTR_01000 [Talaromyces verruculosus]
MQPGPGIKPDYEVRLQLDPSTVLNPNDNELNILITTAFKVRDVINLRVQFLDTDFKDIYNATWSTRIRKFGNKKDFELAYKKRYPVADGDIGRAIAAANNDGFGASDTKYEAQIEWGYQKRTLSITRKKKVDSGNHGTDLPDLSDSRQMLIDKAPDKFNNWKDNKNWGIDALARSRIYGPVLVKRYTGIWNDLELDIENWTLRNATGKGTENIVQISFKTASYQTVLDEQCKLMNFLREKNWFSAKDSLMTQTIMERYQSIPVERFVSGKGRTSVKSLI